MTRRPPTRRRGVTLTEVLVALFVMALGMTALMTLFPLGAFQIAQSLKDDRCAQTATQADAYLRSHWRHHVGAVNNGLPPNSFVWAMDDPNLAAKWPGNTTTGPAIQNTYLTSTFWLPTGTVIPNMTAGQRISPSSITSEQYRNPQPTPQSPPLPADTAYVTFANRAPSPSLPVLLDPVGVIARGPSPERFWVGRSTRAFLNAPFSGNIPLILPRRNFGSPVIVPNALGESIAPTNNAAFNACFLADDLSFQQNGAPEAIDPTTGAPYPQGAQLNRQGRYSWAALIQRPDNTKPDVADLTILVFDGRPPFTIATGVGNSDEEVVTVPQPPVTGFSWQVNSRTATVTLSSRTQDQSPLIRKGGWVLDATINASAMPTGVPIPSAAKFYRIIGVTETAVNPPPGTTTYDLDLDRPIESAPLAGPSQLYFFANLAKVFVRPQLTPYVP